MNYQLRLLSFFISLTLLVKNSQGQIGLNFNGVNNYVSTNGSPVLNNQSRTVDCWIKTTSTITTQMVVCDWGAMTLGQRFTFNVLNNKIRIEVGGVGMTGTTNVNTGIWTHVSAVYESSITSGSNVFLYVNGILDAAGTFTGYPVLTTTTTTGFRIGVRNDGTNFFNGSVDEVKVYNYGRTQAQVAADTIEYCSPQAGLVAYYKLNEGIPNGTNTSSFTAIDYSGFGNNGTLNSFTLTGTSSNWVIGRVNSGAPSIFASPSKTICSGATLSLSTNAVNNFTWSTGASGPTVIVVSPNQNTTYSLNIAGISPSNCASNISITVQSASIALSSSSNSICLGQTVTLNASGANTYTWNNGVTNATTFTPSATAFYSVSANNACGTTTAGITITVTPLPVVATSNSTLVCSAGTATLTAAGAGSFTWTSTSGVSTNSIYVVSPTVSTTYSLIGNTGACIGINAITINTNPLPVFSISVNNSVVCSGQSVTLTAIGNAQSYTWTNNNQTGNSVTINPTATAAYFATASSAAGCTISASQVMVVNQNPVLLTTASKTLVCSGAASAFSVTGASVHSWTGGPTTANYTVNPIQTTTYNVSGTITSTGCYSTASIVVQVFVPNIVASGTSSICPGNSSTLIASGANTYTWSSGTVLAPGSVVVSPTISTIYTVNAMATSTLNTSVSCPGSSTFQVFMKPIPTISVQSSRSFSLCTGEKIILTASGASSYTWNTGAITPTLNVIANSQPSVNYSVTGTSSIGCVNKTFVTLAFSACTSIDEFKNETYGAKIYPNPASDQFTIESNEEVQVFISNVSGEVLIKTILNGDNAYSQQISGLNNGVYFIRFDADGKESVVKRIVISN